MTEDKSPRPRRILIVEDDPGMRHQLSKLLQPYGDELEVTIAKDAGDALRAFGIVSRGKTRRAARRKVPGAVSTFDAMVLDLMMPYGEARKSLSDGDHTELDTGLRLLSLIRESAGSDLLWVAVITARSGLAVAQTIHTLLAGRGKLYLKPFDTLRFEDDLITAVDLASRVPPELLQDHASAGEAL